MHNKQESMFTILNKKRRAMLMDYRKLQNQEILKKRRQSAGQPKSQEPPLQGLDLIARQLNTYTSYKLGCQGLLAYYQIASNQIRSAYRVFMEQPSIILHLLNSKNWHHISPALLVKLLQHMVDSYQVVILQYVRSGLLDALLELSQQRSVRANILNILNLILSSQDPRILRYFLQDQQYSYRICKPKNLIKMIISMTQDSNNAVNSLELTRVIAGNVDLTDYSLFMKIDWAQFFCGILKNNKDSELIVQALLSLQCIMTLQKQAQRKDTVVRMQSEGWSRYLQSLQDHSNEHIYRLSFRIIQRFFPVLQ